LIAKEILSTGLHPDMREISSLYSNGYHLGFHSILSTFLSLTQFDLVKGMLLFGQVLNALIVFPTFLLAKSLTGDKWIGVVAALVPAFITPMPVYYTSWGRYTQLAGLLVLPAAFYLIQILFRHQQPLKGFDTNQTHHRIIILGLVSICLSGLFLTHFRVLVFLFCLLVAYFLTSMISTRRVIYAQFNWRNIGLCLLLLLVTIILVYPSTITIFDEQLIPQLSTVSEPAKLFYDFSWSYLLPGLGKLAVIASLIGMILGLLSMKKFAWTLLGWVVLMFLLANLGYLRMPASHLINNTSVAISLFYPIAISTGYLTISIWALTASILPDSYRWISEFSMYVILLLLSVVGSLNFLTILNPLTYRLREADIKSIKKISELVPAGERVLINPVYWGYGLYAGSDGGYWISPLAGLKTLPPPVIYGFGEWSQEKQEVIELSQKVIELQDESEALHKLLQDHKISFIYLGARSGVLSPAELQRYPGFQELMNNRGTWLFKLIPQQ
jgi:hypothetical protein